MKTGSWQYVVADPSSHSAVIIDPVLDYDPATGTVSTSNADQLLSLVKEKGYRIDMILETHAHADHMTAASYLQKRLSEVQGIDKPLIGIGKRIAQVQKLFGEWYGIPATEYEDVFDKLFDDNEEFHVGSMKALAIHIPGHTPDHVGYKIGGRTIPQLLAIDHGSHTASQIMCSLVTLSFTLTSALLEPTSQEAARTPSSPLGADSFSCRTTSNFG